MAKKTRVKLNYPKIIAAVLVFVLIVGLGGFAVVKLLGNNSENEVQTPTVNMTTDDAYSIRSNATDYQKELYDELKAALEQEDKLVISEALVKNFIADFYTLSNKTIKNDVGGTQFWHQDARLLLRTKAIDLFYNNLELYIRDYGSENLPTVANVTVLGSGMMEEENCYAVEVEWTYVENSVFDTSKFQKKAMFEVTDASGEFYIYRYYHQY